MNKKIFISYSWGNSEHQDWVVSLATRMMNDTVDVVLDRWSLKDGHDVFSFMEEMVKSEEIFRVLIISDRKYSEKADGREGGVGTETQIITPNVYSKEKQEKFIPILLERDEQGEPYLPTYLKSRKYIDFSRMESYEDSYEELLRNVLEAPALPKPKLGTAPPVYITERSINLSETNNKLRTIENQLKKNGSIAFRELNSFVGLFFDHLWEFEQKSKPTGSMSYGEQQFNALMGYRPLREDFIKFVDFLSSYEVESSEEVLVEFFENATVFNSPRQDEGGWTSSRFEIFKIIFQELFIYTVAICMKNKNYALVAELLHSKYYKRDKYRIKKEPESFEFLYHYHESLENYISQVFRKITGFGHYMITNLSDSLTKEDVVLADTLCYFVSYLDDATTYESWFPSTYLYGERLSMNFFQKMTSDKHFQKVKVIFNVSTKQELEHRLNASAAKFTEKLRYGRGGFNSIPFIHELVSPDTIAIHR